MTKRRYKNISKIIIAAIFLAAIFVIIQYNQTPFGNSFNKTKYIAMIDAGSSGSRLYVYKISKPLKNFKNNSIPLISEIKLDSHKIQPGISSFVNNVDGLEKYLEPILQEANKEFKSHKINPKTQVDFYVLGTAGMRLISKAQQQNIYNKVYNIISKSNNYNKIITKTLPGEYEGLFDWLAINYHEKNLQLNKPTSATLDMGGASTQVAFATHNYTDLDNTFTLKFGNAEYTVVSKSFLGLGLNEFRKNFINSKNETDNICMPNPEFDFKTCKNTIKDKLKNKLKNDSPAAYLSFPLESNMKLVGISGYYYKFKFFTIDKISEIPKKTNKQCISSYDDFIKNNLSRDKLTYLQSHCFDTAYIDTLLDQEYKIPHKYENFSVADSDVSWTLGAALFFATQNQD